MQKTILKYTKGQLTLNLAMEEIAKTCKTISTGFFARQIHWRSFEIDSIYVILKKLEPHNPSSLINVERKLRQQINKHFPQSIEPQKQLSV